MADQLWLMTRIRGEEELRLDKFWQHQDMIYDFQAELHGSRSLHSS